MDYDLITLPSGSYVECSPSSVLADEAEALDLVAACGEHGTHNLLLHPASLTPAFFDLRSGNLGRILLKLGNYRIRTALILPDADIPPGHFAEWVSETNHGRAFRVFPDRASAETWLVGTKI